MFNALFEDGTELFDRGETVKDERKVSRASRNDGTECIGEAYERCRTSVSLTDWRSY